MHREDIKAIIRKAYGSVLAFEEAKGLPHRSAKDVLRGRPVAQAERAIAEAVGKPLHELFPLRYDAPEPGESLKRDNKRSGRPAHRLSAGGR